MKLASILDAAHAPIGQHRAPCPACDRGPRDDAVNVTVDATGYVWFCHRCGSKGYSGGSRNGNPTRAAQRQQHDGLAPWAQDLWHASLPLEGVAAAYLRARNCVTPPADSDLRWHPTMKHSPTGYIGPALVTRVTDAATNMPLSLHRTWIRRDGSKAPLDSPRLLAAGHRKAGGVIRLWPDDAVTTGLAVAEGIETALAAAHAFQPVWSCIDAGNLATFPVLAGVECLTIFADSDLAGRKAAEQCAERWHRAGREVFIAEPPAGDWNDRAREVTA